jgi:hypothetical protein
MREISHLCKLSKWKQAENLLVSQFISLNGALKRLNSGSRQIPQRDLLSKTLLTRQRVKLKNQRVAILLELNLSLPRLLFQESLLLLRNSPQDLHG